ncbi:MAG: 3'-5' exonuclease [Bacteroidetes bacterium]|nr:MAG: 3'-5' exonuclease [Bacteroidota bacterium]PTM08745.1 MAG: 3'-5' exonuclease [Bacteroidota bacterium]
MLEQIDIANVLFLDIETVSGQASFADMPADLQELWAYKAKSISKSTEELTAEEVAANYQDRAAIYAEFGKIVCISVGAIHRDKDRRLKIRLKSFASDDEKEVLKGFSELLTQYYDNPMKYFLCGHNIKEFDIPYTCRRMVVQGLSFPKMLDITGKKPWETKHLLDTMELWKFGDRKSYTSLKLLAATLGFPSPKDDIDGSMVGRVFWEENDVDRIAHYCEKDVLATAQLFLRFQLAPLLEADQIDHVGR